MRCTKSIFYRKCNDRLLLKKTLSHLTEFFKHINLTYSSGPQSEATKVSKVAKIRNRYNQVPHLTQDTNGKATEKKQFRCFLLFLHLVQI